MKITFAVMLLLSLAGSSTAEEFRTHPPTRPLPAPSKRPLAVEPSHFVDANKGMDSNPGSAEKPWKTIAHALKQVAPGQTIVLRGGTFYEQVVISRVGTPGKPITIRSHPGELAIIDGGLREFFEAPANSWEPVKGGAEDEYRSTKAYRFGGGFGNFGDSMVPFHRYMNFADLRSTNELFRKELSDRTDDPVGMWIGPGCRRDPETGRIHIRLSHTKLEGLGKHAYRGETDPRKLPLVISGHDYAVRIEGAQHVRLQDLVVRGGQRSAFHITRDEEDPDQLAEGIELDGLTVYGSGSALRVEHTKDLRVLNCNLRGHSAPWHSRFTVKNRSGSGYLISAEGSDFEIAHCELTDHHDCIAFYGLDGLKFHHNLVDNFNDDGIEPGPKKSRGKALVYQNIITRVLNPFTAHAKKPNPVESEPGSGVYVFRNVVDLRQGTYRTQPSASDPSGSFLNGATTSIAHDHGSPTYANYYVYHNTFLLPAGVFRGYYAFTWGGHTAGTTRRVFNNAFVQVEGLPGLNTMATGVDDDVQMDGNLYWGVKEGPAFKRDFFAKYKASKAFEASKKKYAPGWGAGDIFADPKFVNVDEGNFRLTKDSPAIDAGVAIPAEWPDPLREADKGKPDIGALPLGAEGLKVGPARR